MTTAVALEVRGLTKSFGANTALDRVDLTLAPGEIHALVGMNGSGKSTLVKILSGFYTADSGTVRIAGGDGDGDISFVHQDLGLVDSMTVVENMTLGRRPATKFGAIDWRSESQRAIDLLQRFGLEHLTHTLVSQITKAEATIVAIARALGQNSANPAVLVLDEPTSTLPAAQTEQLLQVIDTCADSGIAVLFISHRLQEVLSIASRVTVLYNGTVAYAGTTSGMAAAQLAARIGSVEEAADSDLTGPASNPQGSELRPVLAAHGISGNIITGLDLTINRGEVLGIVGMLGSGVEEVARLLSGRTRPVDGEIATTEPGAEVSIGFVSADRARNGVLPGMSAIENASISGLDAFVKRGAISARAETRTMSALFERLTVYPFAPHLPIGSFSGGNQQKILIARWLHVAPDVLIAEEPTQGVDIHAKAEILAQLRTYAQDGHAVVLSTGEPEEIYAYCDRIVVIDEGRIGAEAAAPITGAQIISLMHERTSHVHR